MKILHLIPSLNKGGAERLCLDICRELSQREGIQVKLGVLRSNNDYTFLSEGLDIIQLDVEVKLSITSKTQINVQALQALVDEFQPDIIHSHLFEMEVISRSINYTDAKWFSHCHDNMPQIRGLDTKTFLNKILLTNFYERQYLLSAYKKNGNNRFIAISKDTQMYFRQQLPSFLSKNITLLHNAIDVNRFNRPVESPNPDDNILQLVSTGSLVDKKNQIFLIGVMEQLRNAGIVAHLHLLGEGANRSKIERVINDVQLNETCTLHGNVANVEQFLWTSHIYLHAATYEPLGLVLLEAMAAGLPVVCLDGRGNRDLMIDGQNGYILDKPDVNEFTAKIISLWQNKELYQSISEYAHTFAQDFDIKIYIDKLLAVYIGK